MRYYFSLFLILILNQIATSQTVAVDIDDNGVLFKEGEQKILFYQTANKNLNGAYTRSNYIHPLYSLNGQVLTEDFPKDHPHHRGIFWAWHQLFVGDKRIGDGWMIQDFKWEVLSVENLETEGKEKSIKAHILWKSPLWKDSSGQEKPLVSEQTTITVYPAKKNYRQIDIKISMKAQEPNTRLGGSEDAKGYGGFSPRVRLADDIKFTDANGTIKPQLLPIKAKGWMDISGSIGHEGAMAGITILSHPENPGYPNPWILRSKGSMQNAVYPYPGAKAVGLSNIEPTVLRYSLLIHNGLEASVISSMHAEYARR